MPTKIPWANESWNYVSGCTPKSDPVGQYCPTESWVAITAAHYRIDSIEDRIKKIEKERAI